MLGQPRRGRGRRRRRRLTGGDIVVPGSETVITPGQSVVAFAPAAVITVERAGVVIASPSTAKDAVALAKKASEDGTEVIIKVRGETLAGYRKGRRVLDLLSGPDDFADEDSYYGLPYPYAGQLGLEPADRLPPVGMGFQTRISEDVKRAACEAAELYQRRLGGWGAQLGDTLTVTLPPGTIQQAQAVALEILSMPQMQKYAPAVRRLVGRALMRAQHFIEKRGIKATASAS